MLFRKQQSSAVRLASMARDTFGRILKTAQAREDKRAFMRAKTLEMLPLVRQLIGENTPDNVITGLRFILALSRV